MARLTILLPDDVETRARKAAKAQGKSVSRWIAEQVAHRLEDAWSRGVLDAAAASPDFPSSKEIRKSHGRDVSRESME